MNGKLLVNQFLVARFEDPDRAEQAATVLKTLTYTGNIELKPVDTRICICVSGKQLITVTPSDATYAKSNLRNLAETWAERLRTALALPAVRFETNKLQVPLGETVPIGYFGSEVETAKITSEGGDVVKFRRDTGQLLFTGVKPGLCSITASTNQGVSQTVRVEVRPLAAKFPQDLNVTVAGIPARQEAVEGAIVGGLQTMLRTMPGGDAKAVALKVSPIGIGEKRTFDIRVRALAPDCFPNEGLVHVKVTNRNLPVLPDAELWYCNDPESVKQAGVLFAAELKPDKPARLLYHHVNATEDSLFIRIRAINTSDKVAEILVIPGESKPERNPVVAGTKAAEEYLNGWTAASGEIVSIPPHSEIPISFHRPYPGQCISGVCGLRLLTGGPNTVLVRAEADEASSVDSAMASALNSKCPWHALGSSPIKDKDLNQGYLSEFIYPHPFQERKLLYTVGGKPKFIRLGEEGIQRHDLQDGLDGNYGVIYTLSMTLTNPTAQSADAELAFEASAGYASALMIVDGQFIRTPYLPGRAEAQVMKFTLAPGATKVVRFTTMPLSGAAYPATFVVRPVGSTAKYRTTPEDERK